jgi:hypothetical protein
MLLCKRGLKVSIGALLATGLAFSGCAGPQSASLLPPVSTGLNQANSPHAPARAGSEDPLASSSALTVSGPIVAMVPGGGFLMAVTQGCNGVVSGSPTSNLASTGQLTINMTSSTTLPGTFPAVGYFAQATGTGSCLTSITATSITLAKAPPSGSCPNQLQTQPASSVLPPAKCLAGQVIGINENGFELASTSCHGRIIVTRPTQPANAPTPIAINQFAIAVSPQLSTGLPIQPVPQGPLAPNCIFSASTVVSPPSPTSAV